MARKPSLLLTIFCLTVSLMISPCASAQAVYGSIFGTVTDPSGAAIPNAKVIVTSVKQGTSETVNTNETGNYTVFHLIPGAYDVAFEAQGFKKAERKAVTVSADVATRLDGSLPLGGSTEVVEVTGEAPQLKTDRADVATLFSEKQVEELPIFNRNFTQFVLLTPGTQQQAWSHASSENPQGSLQTKVNGQTFSGTGFQLDGTENRDPILGIIVVNPPLDSVTEAKITSQNYDAEFGQAIAGVVSSQTKSGSNSIHGTAYGFRRSDATQARNPFANSQRNPLTGRFLPQTLWGQYGGSVGGPIIKNKLFFFGDYQATRRKNGRSFTQTVPTLQVRNSCLSGGGCDLSQYGAQIFDPQSANGATPFTNNFIPNSRLSPQALAILAALPAPTNPTALVSNFAANGSGIFNDDQFDVRIDHQTSDKMHTFGRYSLADYRQNAEGAFGDLGGAGFGEGGFAGQSNSRNQSIAAGFDYALSANLLTDFRFGWMRYKVEVSPQGVGTTPATDIGIPNLNIPGDDFTSGQPGFFIGEFGDAENENTGNISRTGGISGVGFGLGVNRCNCPLLESEQQYQFVNNWTRIQGNHSFKFGADIRYALNLRVPSDRHRAGELSFQQGRTAGPAGVGGVALATFLLGDVTRFTRYVSTSTNAAERQKRWFFYGQDTFRLTPKFTLSYGLRWDIYFPESVNDDRNGGLLDLSTGNIHVAGVGGIGRNFDVENSFKNLAPRLGIAYQLTDKTVLRLGYGRSFDIGVFGSIFGHTVTQNLPVLSTQENNAAQAGGQFTSAVFNLAAGPSAPLFPAVPADGLLPLPGGVSGRARPFRMRLPTLDAWNVTVQHQLTPTVSVEAAYVANKGTNGFTANNPDVNVNQPTVVGFASGVSRDLRKPFFNIYPFQSVDPMTGACNSFDAAGNPTCWAQDIDFKCNCASSNYNSLQTKIEKRFSKGFSVLAHYTWSKSLTYTNEYYNIDPRVSYGPDDFNRKHVFVFSEVYELPVGRGKKYMADANRWLDLLIGGYQINSVTNWSSGLPFSPSYQQCGSDRDTGPCRVIVNGDAGTGGDRDQFFTPASELLALNGQTVGPYVRPGIEQFGNRRNSLYGPGFFNTDLSIFKNFIVTEAVRVQFRAEAFNVFNHVNLGLPASCVDCDFSTTPDPITGVFPLKNPGQPRTDGKITSIQSPSLMRQFQFGLRVTF